MNRPRGSHDWVSPNPVKPEKVEKLRVKDYIHLIKKPTKREKEDWFKKYKDKLK